MSIDPIDATKSASSSNDPSLPNPTTHHVGCSRPPLPLRAPPAAHPRRSARLPTPSNLPPSTQQGSWAVSSIDSLLSLEKDTTCNMRTTNTKEVLRSEKDISSYSISREDGTSSKSNCHFQRPQIGKVDASPATDMTSDTSNTRGSMNSAGRRNQMINGNHLLNFQYLPIVRPIPKVNSHRKAKNVQPYNKDRFLQANFKFVVLASGEYASEHIDPDTMLRWEDVVCVRYSTPSPVQCPICLEDPLSPQITSCGHIFCFPCIVRYLRMGEEDKRGHSWKKCPLCFTLISSKELSTICIDNVRQYNVGDIVTFSLLTRAKDSLLPSEKVPRQGLMSSDRLYDPFSKFTLTSDVGLAVREPQSELEDWLARADLGLVDDIEQLPYVCASLELLDDRKKLWGEQQIKVSLNNCCHHASEENPSYSSTCTLGGNVHASKMSESLEKVQNQSNGILSSSVLSKSDLIQFEDNGETTKPNKFVDKCNNLKESYNFYQAFDGQLLILHPLNMKCLLHHFGSYDFLPPRISGKILQLETVVQSAAMRRRYRYLSHFPLTTSFKMCEIDMSETLPPEALASFMAEIKKRHKDRNKLERKNDEAKAKAEAAETELLSVPFHFSDIQLSSSTAAPFSMDDFEALGNTLLPTRSPAVSGERTRFSDVARLGFAAAHDSPALTLKQPSYVSQISGSGGAEDTKTTAPAKLSYAGVISAAKTSNSSEVKKVARETQKKGKKASRVIFSTAGGRRY